MDHTPLISIVSPVYRGEELLDTLVKRVKNTLKGITENYEIILVEDCGPDNSWNKIEDQASSDARVKGIKLSRNFGQHYAISAGLDLSRGEWVVVMDCDLQDQPEEIPRLLEKAHEGYDIVLARRHNRQDKFFKKLFSKLFYGTLGYLTGSYQDSSVANFGIYHKKVIQTICSMRESIRYFPTMVKWVGFNATSLDVEHAPRTEGNSSYNFKRLLNLALDIILAYSDKPLRLVVKTGLVISFVSFVGAIITTIRAITGDITVIGYASLIVSIWFFAGLIIVILGVIGLYLGKTFEGVKDRPVYVIDKKTWLYDDASEDLVKVMNE